MVKLSDQKTPKCIRRVRRGQPNPSRGMSAEQETQSFKDKFINIVKHFQKKDLDSSEEIKPTRRNVASGQSRDTSTRSNYKTHHVFNEDKTGDADKKKRRLKHKIKTLLLYGCAGAAIIAVIVIVIISIAKNSGSQNLSEKIQNENLIKVTVYIENIPSEIYTEAKTIDELFAENGITVASNQKCSGVADDILTDGMEIFISSAMSVSIVNDGITNSATMYGGKVSDAFEAMEIELDDYDIVDPDVDTLVYDGIKIQFTDVQIKQVTVVEDLPYETEEGETSTVESGYYHVEQDGEKGAVEIIYEVTLIDGEEQSRTEISRETIKDPVNRIILWGTATPSSKASTSTDSSSSSDSSTSYDDATVKNPGEQATNPSLPSPPGDYVEIMYAQVTAYTHTGSTTATGTWPRSTRTLANPGTCAVVPSTIPYGSLLYVTGYGYCIAEDTGGFRTDPDRWNQIDLFMNTEQECIIWGRRYDVTVYILRKGY